MPSERKKKTPFDLASVVGNIAQALASTSAPAPVSTIGELSVPFGVTFEQGQALRDSMASRDAMQQQLFQQGQALRAEERNEAARLAMEQRRLRQEKKQGKAQLEMEERRVGVAEQGLQVERDRLAQQGKEFKQTMRFNERSAEADRDFAMELEGLRMSNSIELQKMDQAGRMAAVSRQYALQKQMYDYELQNPTPEAKTRALIAEAELTRLQQDIEDRKRGAQPWDSPATVKHELIQSTIERMQEKAITVEEGENAVAGYLDALLTGNLIDAETAVQYGADPVAAKQLEAWAAQQRRRGVVPVAPSREEAPPPPAPFKPSYLRDKYTQTVPDAEVQESVGKLWHGPVAPNKLDWPDTVKPKVDKMVRDAVNDAVKIFTDEIDDEKQLAVFKREEPAWLVAEVEKAIAVKKAKEEAQQKAVSRLTTTPMY